MNQSKRVRAKIPEALAELIASFIAKDDKNQTDSEVLKATYEFIVSYVQILKGYSNPRSAKKLIQEVASKPVPADSHKIVVYGVLQRCLKQDFEDAAVFFRQRTDASRSATIDTPANQVNAFPVLDKGILIREILKDVASKPRPNRRKPHRACVERWVAHDPAITPQKIIELFDCEPNYNVDFFAETIKGPGDSVVNFRAIKDMLYEARKKRKSI